MSLIAALLLAFFVLCAAGVVASLVVPARSSPVALAAIATIAAGVLLATGAALLSANQDFRFELWPVLSVGTLELAADRLSAVLMLAAGLVYVPVSIFSGVYLGKYASHYSLRYFGICYHLLFASVVLVLIAGDALSFLAAWELMSIFSYLLVTYDLDREEARMADS